MAHTTGRYTSSPESALESDLKRIADIAPGDGAGFVEELDRIVRSNFTRDYWDISLPNKLDTSAPRSPALFAYLASLNLLDAEMLFSRVRIRELSDASTGAPRAMERHHLFPKAHLASLGVEGTRQTNAIANMAFLDWSENAKISGSAPAKYWSELTVGIEPARLKRQIEHHALPVGWEQLDYSTFLEKRRQLIARVVREGFATLSGHSRAAAEATVQDLIAGGESDTVEFKSTARVNLHTGQADHKMEHVIVKTVCGLLNHEGGNLLIGVADDGVVLGIETDLTTLGSKADVDGFELYLRQLLDTNLTVPTAQVVRIRFELAEGKQVCRVAVGPASRPVFAKGARGGPDVSEFWVRVGNATKQLHGDDMVGYQRDHWG